ncbi:MAG: DUF4345 family protein [Bacteroidetes bacterium]|nr:DUF4345 family protein [Bacteroidota bacterium]
MAQNKNTKLLSVALIIYIVVVLVYGVLYLLAPQVLVEAQGGDLPVASGWLRWSGGVLIALGVGAIMVYRNPEKQDAFVVSIALGSLLAGLALLYALFFETTGDIWFTVLPVIILLGISLLLWLGRMQAKDVLCPKEEE